MTDNIIGQVMFREIKKRYKLTDEETASLLISEIEYFAGMYLILKIIIQLTEE